MKPNQQRRPQEQVPPPASVQATATPEEASSFESRESSQVAERAYFIAEERLRNGLPGNELDDWLQAERESAPRSPDI